MSLIVSGWPPPGGKKKLLLTLFWCIHSFIHSRWTTPLANGSLYFLSCRVYLWQMETAPLKVRMAKKPTIVCFKRTTFSLALRSKSGAKAFDLRRVPSDAPKLRTTDHWALKSYKNSWMQLPCKSDFGVQLNVSGPAEIASPLPLSRPLHPRSRMPKWRR